jgi:hypothetical protein
MNENVIIITGVTHSIILYSFDNAIVPAVNEHEGELGKGHRKKSTNGKHIFSKLLHSCLERL